MKFGIDIDGVLANFTDHYAKLITEECGVHFPPNSNTWPTVWYWEREVLIPQFGKEEATRIEKAVWAKINSSSFWRELPTLPGAKEAFERMKELRYAGHQIYFITQRPGAFAKFQTEGWFASNGFPSATVLVADDEQHKGALAAALGLDIFIDDKPANCVAIASVLPDTCRVMLVSAPYNVEFFDARIERVPHLNVALRRAVEENDVQLAA